MQILIIEDEKRLADALGQIMQEARYQADIVYDGRDGLAYASSGDYDVIVLDVREQDEYDSGHIPGAVLLPVGTIDEDTAGKVIPEKDSTVLVYCRSGNRSKTASETLVKLGYTKVYEFGGINTWPYDIEQ